MGSIFFHGQGKAGAAFAVFFDGAEKFMDAQPINPPVNRAPAPFNKRRRDGSVWVFPLPMVVFSFPSPSKVLYCSFRFFGKSLSYLISSVHFPNHGPYDDKPRKCRFSSSHAQGGFRHGSIGRQLMPRVLPDDKVRRRCRCACFCSPSAHQMHPGDKRHSKLTTR